MSIVRDFLKEKDEDYSKYIPPSYKLDEDKKTKLHFMIALRMKH